ncbi:hypothetical protein Tco_0856873 [Tanacetum coccineum]|uniref:Uncharacterized protein n=1 Tax=Tanacetum coccineum TaxID=301880 RepID=A0ABQ5B4N0_9ASTR
MVTSMEIHHAKLYTLCGGPSTKLEQRLGNSTITQRTLRSHRSLIVTIFAQARTKVQFRRTSLTGFPAQSIRSSNAIALDSPYLPVLITEMSQSRQHVDTSLIHLESRKSPTKSLFDFGSRRISIVTVNTREYHSDVLEIITRIMRRTY